MLMASASYAPMWAGSTCYPAAGEVKSGTGLSRWCSSDWLSFLAPGSARQPELPYQIMKAETTFSLKDQLFNPESVGRLADLFSAAMPTFPGASFQAAVLARFPELGLKERISHMTVCLRERLPSDYPDAVAILLQALPPELDPTRTDDDFGDFIIAPFSHFVAQYGCTRQHLAISLDALRAITKRFSAENAIRYFLNAFPAETLAFLDDCARDNNYHVRRLASEGSRPKLPWAQKLNIGYRDPLPLLDQLYADPTRYVTRSVANHLNDISKLDPDLVVSTLTRWQTSDQQAAAEMDFIIRHSLRTLIKQGDKGALTLLGYGETPDIEIVAFQTDTPAVKIGEAFIFTLTIKANKPQKLLVDYQMQFVSNSNRPGQKMFKLRQLALATGESVTIQKKHPMRLMTTRRLYPGEHQIQLQINGQPFGSLSFELLA